MCHFYCNSEYKQLKKQNKIRWKICKSGSIYPYLQSSKLFKLDFEIHSLIKFI